MQAILKKEGENFLLAAQVQQYKKRCAKTAGEANLLAGQLSQAMQWLTPSGRHQQVDRARGVVQSVQKALLRIGADTPEIDGYASEHSQPQSPLGDPSSSTTSLWTTPREGTGPKSTTSRQGSHGGGSSGNEPLSRGKQTKLEEGKVSSRERERGREALELLRRERNRRMEAESKAQARTKLLENERDSALADLDMLRRQVDMLDSKLSEVQQRTNGSQEASASPNVSRDVAPRVAGHRRALSSSAASRNGSATPRDTLDCGDGSSLELALVQVQLAKQREMLTQVVRRCVAFAEEASELRDDLTRRDVVIHNLRQEQQQVQQQYVQLQQLQMSQLEQRQQEQLQQQAQLQQLQHLQQLRQLLQEQQTEPEQVEEGEAERADAAGPEDTDEQVASDLVDCSAEPEADAEKSVND
mmetsp:Transcript_5379/g.13000  ORF Transcript_5379/g.13000 Transcript_5379/m.13000 type:complete len:414 (-) Transcript_5379:92-1333(-)